MKRQNISDSEYQHILDVVAGLLFTNGIKSTTMDSVAHHLGISKRTLYEMFESKRELLSEALRHICDRHLESIQAIYAESGNVMEAMLKICGSISALIKKVNADFFRDMDRLYADMRGDYDRNTEIRREGMMRMFRLGIEQGVLRHDVDYRIQIRLMDIQMESLKRMEEFFPPGITMEQAYTSIYLTFLRGTATRKGLDILDALLKKKQSSIINNL